MKSADKSEILKTERVLRALGNRRRLAILQMLNQHDSLSVGSIAERLHLSFAATSRHLRVLAGADLIESEQQSTTVNYALSKQRPSILDTVLKNI
ncbi:hypothetical protein A3C86_02795 [Candidatus Kaiserbacteria bacterium RIFCSPHIGHO2_02_FULL_49_16]|uniref:HTH arsR-type domain-containing protein n=1 Tax=Candidatus Kaiserbacteria bacterium RIFCSPHIGHO2_02_FULL_49_16 TaxID=1798490 RepID=A0A1F6DHL5_9BACT|nr:MAG: hypothetical protein A3C86_02795 [Candidatus Kaiserbacteria bacterium RIFCSPHIGHO2_02_FULL_49_16]